MRYQQEKKHIYGTTETNYLITIQNVQVEKMVIHQVQVRH